MNTFIMLVGISGSGKSTYIENYLKSQYDNLVIVSSDAIRGELYGDESVQDNPGKVFQIAHERVKEALKEEKNVVLDATNLNRRKRMGLLHDLSVMKAIPPFESVAHVILETPQQCIARQDLRERKVPDYVILRQAANFQMPTVQEGFTQPPFVFNCGQNINLLSELLEQCKGFDQRSVWHTEALDKHIEMVVKYAELANFSFAVIEAAQYHDVGKLFTRTYDDNGNAHFHNHALLSAYLYLCAKAQTGIIDKELLHIEQIIERHDDVLNIDISNEKYRKNIDGDLYKDLINFSIADTAGAITKNITQETSLYEYINNYPDWELRLQNDPFNIKIKRDGDYILFKYNQFNSDMSYRIVQESRGSIFKEIDGKLEYVCRPFDKFFNHGQTEEHSIDWNSARVTEKIDGSLHKLWFDDGKWHLSTNGTIDAFKAEVSDTGLTFGDIFERAVQDNVEHFCSSFDPNFTYMFELTSPDTKLVIPYDDGVYYLAKRNTKNGLEDFSHVEIPHIQYPKSFALNNIDDVVTVVSKMGKNEEGVVVNDANGNRIKVKSPEYLLAFHSFNNGNLSYKKTVDLIKNEQADDIVAMFPEFQEKINFVSEKIENFASKLEEEWNEIKENLPESKKDLASMIHNSKGADFLFKKYENQDLKALDYILSLSNTQILSRTGIKEKHFTR